MSCLPGGTDAASMQPICGDLPESAVAAEFQDPFEAWLGLMEVVEGLCPVWPAREVGLGGEFRM